MAEKETKVLVVTTKEELCWGLLLNGTPKLQTGHEEVYTVIDGFPCRQVVENELYDEVTFDDLKELIEKAAINGIKEVKEFFECLNSDVQYSLVQLWTRVARADMDKLTVLLHLFSAEKIAKLLYLPRFGEVEELDEKDD